jgi:hypothetical protein
MSDVRLLNTNDLEKYNKFFLNGGGRMDTKYSRVASSEDRARVRGLGGDVESLDTPLEIALLSTCAGVIDVRPVEAVEMLGTAREADLKLGAAVYMDMQAAKFLGSDSAPYATALKFITDRGRVTEANIKDFVKQGIAAAVDDTFGMSDPFLTKSNTNPSSYTTRIAYKNTVYILNYAGYHGDTEFSDKIEANSIADLLSAMKKNSDFDQNCIQAVQHHASMIPAIVLAQTGTTEVITGTVKKVVTDFYLNPTTLNYNTLVLTYQTFLKNEVEFYRDDFFGVLSSAYGESLSSLNNTLARKISEDAHTKQYAGTASLPIGFTDSLKATTSR